MSSELNEIQNKFKNAFEEDFIILDGVVKPDRYDKNYWLVRIKPKKSGLFIINHFFEDETVSKDGYCHKSHEFHISVKEKGTRRTNRYNAAGQRKQTCPDIWLGDTLIIPIFIMDYAKDHRFSKKTKWAENMDWLKNFHFDKDRMKYDIELDKKDIIDREIMNKNLPELEGITVRQYDEIPRRGIDINFDLLFEARAPSNFNLKLSGSGFADVIIPIRIVPIDQPIESLASYAMFNEANDEYNSAHNLWFHLNIATLRPGDRLLLNFFKKRFLNIKDSEGVKDKIKDITISKLPFSAEHHSTLIYNPYDYWLDNK